TAQQVQLQVLQFQAGDLGNDVAGMHDLITVDGNARDGAGEPRSDDGVAAGRQVDRAWNLHHVGQRVRRACWKLRHAQDLSLAIYMKAFTIAIDLVLQLTARV